jgi:hypothetical protein
MNEFEKEKKYGSDKIALLGLFILAVLTAYIITALKSAVTLTEPIELSYTGLSVSMPNGNGWRCEKNWSYGQNAFVLKSFFTINPARHTAEARCRYLLAAENTPADLLIEQKAYDLGGTIIEKNRIQTELLNIEWAYIKNEQHLLDIYFGTTRLPNNRQLDIEVLLTDNTDLAAQTFKLIAENIKFQDNQLLNAGSQIVQDIKDSGISSFLPDQSRQDLFLIKDEKNRPVGFTTDVLIDSTQDAPLNIQAAGFLYIRGGRYAQEQAMLFQCSNNLDEFSYKRQSTRSGAEITMNKTGTMTVKTSGRYPKEINYQPGPSAIPDVFLEFLLNRFIDSYHEKLVIDIIRSDGTINPTLLSRIKDKVDNTYILKLDFLGGQRFSELIYLDNQKNILKRLLGIQTPAGNNEEPLSRRNILTFERDTAENILRQFPERADYILQKHKMLDLKDF